MFITTTLTLERISARIICNKNSRQSKFIRLFTNIGTSEGLGAIVSSLEVPENVGKAQKEPTVKYLRFDSTEVQQELAATKYLRYDSSGHDSSGVFCEVLKQDKLMGVQCIITAKMRSTLSQQLQFSNEDISQMSPQFAAKLIKAEWKKELGTSEEDMKCLKDYYSKYRRLPCGSIGYTDEEQFEVVHDMRAYNRIFEKYSLSAVKESPRDILYLLE